MRLLIFLLSITFCYAQTPLTVSEIKIGKNKSSHGFAVGNWLTVDGSGVVQKGSDPDTQAFFGIVARIGSTDRFEYVTPGNPISGLSGLVAGSLYYGQTDGTIALTPTSKPVLWATSTTAGVLFSGSYGEVDTPSTQSSDISFSSIGSTIVTVSWASGDGEGDIVLMDDSPIIQLPVLNGNYSPSLVFGSGAQIGDAYVMFRSSGTDPPINITGLTANTLYYALVISYNEDGLAVKYNSTIDTNTGSFTTLSSVTTPTVQWETTSKKSKETGIEVTGTRGNGDQIIALSSNLDEPDTDPVDGVSYSLGQTLGNATVAYIGTASTFFIDGYTQDRKVWWKVMELENTGVLYNVTADIDSAFTAYIYDNEWIESTDPPGLTYLENTSYVYYDFSLLTFADEANITNGDAGLVDQSGNANTATIVGSSPQTNAVTLNSAARKASRSASGTGLSTGNNGTTWFSNASGVELHFSGELTDGVVASGVSTVAGTQGTGWRCDYRWVADGRFQIQYTTAAGATNWVTTAATVVNGVNIITHGKIKLDFVNDVFSVSINGTNYPGATSGGVAISAHNPTTFSSSQAVYIGNTNNAGSPSGMTSGTTLSISRIAFTPLTTTQESTDIGAVMAYTATAGNTFVDWDKEGSFDAENLDDSLHLDGTESGPYVDRLIHIDILPDTLEEYEIEMTFRITGALTTAASGLGIGTLNDLATENNYAVMGQINLDTDATSFGKGQIFSGNGTIDNDDFSHRATSSSAFIPAQDSTYRARLRRILQGNDAFYSFEVYDYYDSTVVTIGWLETGRPSSAYYGTTNRAFIWYQGPDFKIGEFSVVRVGEDVSPPAIVTADVYATLGGVDTANGTVTAPRRTLNGAIQRCAELGYPCVISMGPGRFEESTRPTIPAQVSIFGAGKDVTEISGTVSLEQPFSSNTTYAFLKYMNGSTTSGGDQYLRDLTIEGRQRKMTIGMVLNKRDDVIIEDVAFRNFNWGGVFFQECDDVIITRITFDKTGGDNAQPPANVMVPPPITSPCTYVAGAVAFGFVSNLVFTDCTIDNSVYRTGYCTKANTNQPGVAATLTNVTWTGGSMINHPQSAFQSAGDGSLIADISIELFPATFSNVLFENMSVTGGYLSIINPTTATYAGSGYIIFDNIDYAPQTGAFEFGAHKITFKNSYVHGFVRRLVWQTTITTPSNIQEFNFLNNVFELSNVTSHLNVFNRRMIDCEFTGNTFIAVAGSKPATAPFIQLSGTGGTSSFTIENNIFQNAFSTGAQGFWNVTGSGLTSSFVRGNRSTNILITDTVSGVTGGSGNNNTITAGANPWVFQFSGIKPFPYYTPSASLNGAGQGGGNIGARETDVP